MPKFFNHNSLKPFPLPDESVNLVVTSPPYFALRDYKGHVDQIGMETSPQEYVDKIVQVGENVKKVLANDGSYWLNIGDTYDKDKSLWLIPHRVAIAMRDSGWTLRNTIIWHKPNHMPCSIKDRLTPSHEYVFFFTKSRKYYFDLDAIREPHQTLSINRFLHNKGLAAKIGREIKGVEQSDIVIPEWAMPEEANPEPQAHELGYKNTKLSGQDNINIGARGGFAARGETMENRYSDGGKNPGDVIMERKFTREDELRAAKECGFLMGKSARTTARLHVVSVKGHPLGKNPGDVHSSQIEQGENTEGSSDEWLVLDGFDTECPSCGSQFQTPIDRAYIDNPKDFWSINTEGLKDSHYAVFPTKLVETIVKCSSKVGDTVLDCFSGSGTTAIVAESMNRKGVGFDLSYDDVRERRVARGIQTQLIIEDEG